MLGLSMLQQTLTKRLRSFRKMSLDMEKHKVHSNTTQISHWMWLGYVKVLSIVLDLSQTEESWVQSCFAHVRKSKAGSAGRQGWMVHPAVQLYSLHDA